jgi:ring-1,2-phenylacetyl-CoA epoxidase subunit PaaD
MTQLNTRLGDEALRQKAIEAASTVVDPEIPVLTIADLGVLREVTVQAGMSAWISPPPIPAARR